MNIKIGITGREAIEILARERGVTPSEVLKSEIAAHRALSGRGALYRAIVKDSGAVVKDSGAVVPEAKNFYRCAL
jgi:hypothetical protein